MEKESQGLFLKLSSIVEPKQLEDLNLGEAKKSRGVNYIAQREQLNLNETAAFGDGPNDIPMLKLVGMPIVMANGLPNVKKVARHLTADNAHDGVGQGIDRFILGK